MIGVKRNQLTLYHQIQNITAELSNQYSAYTILEVNRGRTELRHVRVINIIDEISKTWKGLQQVIPVHRMVKDKSITREEKAYFISSKKENALFYEQGIRGRWEIENSLHWVKDVTLKEDCSKIRKGNAPQNLSTIKNIGINLFRCHNYGSIVQAMRLVANNIEKLYSLVS